MMKHLEKNLNKLPLKILIIYDEKTNKEEIEALIKESWRYFNITWDYLKFDEHLDLENLEIPDIMFIDFKENYEKIFNWEFYDFCHKKNPIYLQVAILEKFSRNDYHFFKIGNDEIIYKDDGYEFLKWKLIAILRRSWDSHGKKTTIIYKGMIWDNVKKVFYFNESKIHLTKKESELMSILMNNAGRNFVSKQKIFAMIWNDHGEDYTRVVDQVIFKIKKKIGKEVFEITKKGIKII